MSKTKLLPCPFCGGEDIRLDKTKNDTFHLAVCKNCASRVSGFTREGAIKRWNTRKPMDDIVEQLEDIIEPYTPSCNEYNRGVCDAIDIARNAGKDGGEL